MNGIQHRLGKVVISAMLSACCLLGAVFLPIPFSGLEPVLLPAASAQSLQGFSPKTYKDGRQYGTGIFFAGHSVDIYEEPSEDSPKVESFTWSKQSGFYGLTSRLTNQAIGLRNVFICYYPQVEVAMMSVLGESAGLGPDGKEIIDPEAPVTWVEVVYDQSKGKSGWTKLRDEHAELAGPKHLGAYQSWLDFMKYNAKTVGIYWLTGVSQYQRGIRQKDSDDSEILPMMVIKDMKVKHVRGNWLLVEALDFENNTPIGWVRWRDNDGNLLAFPNLSQEKGPVVVTGF